MKKIIRMYPAFDKRDETLNYGRHGEELFRLLTEQGDEGIWNEFERLYEELFHPFHVRLKNDPNQKTHL